MGFINEEIMINDKYEYNYIFIKATNENDVEYIYNYLKGLGFDIDYKLNALKQGVNTHNLYFRLEKGRDDIGVGSLNNIDRIFHRKSYDKIYSINDIKNRNLDLIIKDGKSFLGYSKKILDKSIQESMNVYPYRFKTEEEMIRDYGWNWRDDAFLEDGIGWNVFMDPFLGKELKLKLHELNFDNKFVAYNGYLDPLISHRAWIIDWGMVTKNDIKPSYVSMRKKGKLDKDGKIIKESKDQNYEEFVIRVDNQRELDIAKLRMKEIGFRYKDFNLSHIQYPNWLYVNLLDKDGMSLSLWSDSTTEDLVSGYKELNKQMYPVILRINDINKLGNYIKTGSFNYKPTYGKKHITKNYRLIESINNNYNCVIFKIDNNDDFIKLQELLFNNGFVWIDNSYELETLRFNQSVYIFIYLEIKKFIYNYESGLESYNYDLNIEIDNEKDAIFNTIINIDIEGTTTTIKNINPVIFTKDDFEKIKNILGIIPNYKPKRKGDILIKENYINNNDSIIRMVKIEKLPKIFIGDKVKINLSKDPHESYKEVLTINSINRINTDFLSLELKVISKFTFSLDHVFWWSEVENPKGDTMYIPDIILSHNTISYASMRKRGKISEDGKIIKESLEEDKYKFVFKTIEELEKEYGKGWRRSIGVNSYGMMDYLYDGSDLDYGKLGYSYRHHIKNFEDLNNYLKSENEITYDGWWICLKSLKIKRTRPFYEPKKIIKE